MNIWEYLTNVRCNNQEDINVFCLPNPILVSFKYFIKTEINVAQNIHFNVSVPTFVYNVYASVCSCVRACVR